MAKNNTNLDNIAIGQPLTYDRNNAIPLDASEIYQNFEAANEYAQGEQTVAYVGQIIKVINEDKKTADVYVIKDTDGNLAKLPNFEEVSTIIQENTPGFAYYSAEAEKASGYIRGGAIDRMFKSLQTTIASLQSTITSLQSTVVTQATQITSLQSSVNSLSIRIGDWEDDGENNGSNSSSPIIPL